MAAHVLNSPYLKAFVFLVIALLTVTSFIIGMFFRSWDVPNWLLNLNVLITTVVLAIAGWSITESSRKDEEKHSQLDIELSKCRTLLTMWAENCDTAAIHIERALNETTSELPLNKIAAMGERAKSLSKRALSIVSSKGGNLGQPAIEKVHIAKHHLNRWAEDVLQVFQDGSRPHDSFYPAFQQRARSFILYAEPLNWAWHRYNNPVNDAGIDKANERLEFMWNLAKYETQDVSRTSPAADAWWKGECACLYTEFIENYSRKEYQRKPID